MAFETQTKKCPNTIRRHLQKEPADLTDSYKLLSVFKQTKNVQVPSKDIFRKYQQMLKYPENYVVFSNRLMNVQVP